MSKVSYTPCPRCGCYLTRYFECNCGEMCGDYCVNCGRWTTLSPSAYTELSPFDVRCDAGRVEHEHSEEEKGERLRRYFEKGLG